MHSSNPVIFGAGFMKLCEFSRFKSFLRLTVDYQVHQTSDGFSVRETTTIARIFTEHLQIVFRIKTLLYEHIIRGKLRRSKMFFYSRNISSLTEKSFSQLWSQVICTSKRSLASPTCFISKRSFRFPFIHAEESALDAAARRLQHKAQVVKYI